MRSTIITLFSFFLILTACSSKENMMADHEINLISAEYIHWSEAPTVQSDVRERGTDLELQVGNWPEGAVPRYIIYRKMRSFPAEITDSTENGVVIFGRIIRSSAVMNETSKRVEQSDRLVFSTSDGETAYIEIEEWDRMED